MNCLALFLIETNPMPVWQTENKERYIQLSELILGIFGEDKTWKWKKILENEYGVEIISFKHNKTDFEKEHLFPLEKLYIFRTMFPNNQLLKELNDIRLRKYKKENLYLVQDFCAYLNETYGFDYKRNQMFQILRDNGFLEKVENSNVPTDYANLNNIFKIVDNVGQYNVYDSTGYICFHTPYITETRKRIFN